MRRAAFVLVLLLSPALAAQSRIASDYEIKQMEEMLAVANGANDFRGQLAAHLNLGELRRTRNETALAAGEYKLVLQIAQRERGRARIAGDIKGYATATLYAGLAQARLGEASKAFALEEEAIRYRAEDGKTWNIYSSAMNELSEGRKAVSASRNAVALADKPVDLAIHQFGLALSLANVHEDREAVSVLESLVASLKGKDFERLRKSVAQKEAFEINGTVTTDEAAFISLINRAQLQLADLYEKRGDEKNARRVYEDVLKARTDDADALGALARLGHSDDKLADAFDANPFSINLVRDYRNLLRKRRLTTDGTTTGAQMRRALEQMARNENRAARTTLDALLQKFPYNDTVLYVEALNDVAIGDLAAARGRNIRNGELSREVGSAVAAASKESGEFLTNLAATLKLLAGNALTREQRSQLDRTTLEGTATFDSATATAAGQTIFESGTVDGVPFRFAQPTAFAGRFAAAQALRLSYRILGATDLNGVSALLIEPLKVEPLKVEPR
jgi:hypothetical protein